MIKADTKVPQGTFFYMYDPESMRESNLDLPQKWRFNTENKRGQHWPLSNQLGYDRLSNSDVISEVK